MTQTDLARLCDVARAVSRLVLGALGVAVYLLARPVVRSVRRGNRQGAPDVSSSSAARSSDRWARTTFSIASSTRDMVKRPRAGLTSSRVRLRRASRAAGVRPTEM